MQPVIADKQSDRLQSIPASLLVLLTRQSAHNLIEPAPNEAELAIIFDAAMRAPDHGKLRPWRFLLLQGDARRELGERFANLLAARKPDTPPTILERYRQAPLSAPLMIGLSALIETEGSIPEVEQILAVGAATMNILNALHALGYGGMWVTGANCYDPAVSSILGLDQSHKLLGFLYVGTPAEDARQARRPHGMNYVTIWNPNNPPSS